MRRYDADDAKNLNAESWQLDLLNFNPEYVYWGCFEDYMSNKDSGWQSRVITPTWKEFKSQWTLDEYNECVNFYFEVIRKNHECEYCEGSGYNPETKKLSDDWYSFGQAKWIYISENKRYNDLAWSNHLTEVEVEALVKSGRLWDFVKERCFYDEEAQSWIKWVGDEKVLCDAPIMPTPEQVNEWNKKRMGHDCINKSICVEARAKHLGFYGLCEHCQGNGILYDDEKAHVSLQLWILHPRKGCSRGVYIENVEQEDIPQIIEFLQEAAKRNAERFSKINNFNK